MLQNKSIYLVTFFLFISKILLSQSEVEKNIQILFKKSLTDGRSYEWLDHLSNKIGGRLSGSLNSQRSIEWSKNELENLGLDKVYLQPVMVPKWIRGTFEYANIEKHKTAKVFELKRKIDGFKEQINIIRNKHRKGLVNRENAQIQIEKIANAQEKLKELQAFKL